MIELRDITKRYGKKAAVNHVSFTIEAGEIVGLLGPNGAGKTTIMNILTGYISCNEGTAMVAGFDVLKQPLEVKQRIGYLPEQPPLYQDMTVEDYLHFVYDLKKAKQPKQEHLDEIMGLVKITDVKHRLIKNLSKGYKQRVGMAQALVGHPPILIFDEPTVGLDPQQMTEIRSLIKKLGKQKTVILSSHILSEISAVCDRVIIINKGEVVASDTIQAVTAQVEQSSALIARITGDKTQVIKVLQGLTGVVSVAVKPCDEPDSYDYQITVTGDVDIRKSLFDALAGQGHTLMMLSNKTMSLEDVFLQLTMSRKQKAKEGDAHESDLEA